MITSPAEVGYLRFVLHGKTDGILMATERPTGVMHPVPETQEIRELLNVFAERGVRKVRLVGDDPGVREDLPEVIRMLAGMERISEVAMTTRGPGLAGRMTEIAEAGLCTINFDLDTLRPERYAQITGRDGFREVWRAVQGALAAGLQVKLNTVLQKEVNDDEIDAFVELTADQPIEVRFVEWNACTDRVAPPERFVPTWEAMAAVKPPLSLKETGPLSGPALVFEIEGHLGSIGFIPNVTEHFCSHCNRMGLTDYGEVVSCIFGRGLSLVRHLRAPGGLASVEAFVDRVWRRKTTLAAKLAGWEAVPAPLVDAQTR